MAAKDNSAAAIAAAAAGLIPVTWFSLLIAPYIDEGLSGIMENFSESIKRPLDITMCENSFRTVFIFVLVYALIIGIALSSRRNLRRGEEHGSARWGRPSALNKIYADRNCENNVLLTKNVCMSMNTKIHQRNLNVLVIGGSGAGKTRYYVLPNLMQANCSFVALDPKGELTRGTGGLLEKMGYDVRVLDLINMEKSHGYNPFVYIQDDNDAQRLATNIFKATTPKGSQSMDPFWDQAANMLLMALILYLRQEAPMSEQNFAMVMEMIRYGDVSEDNEDYVSPLDMLFDELEEKDPGHIALNYYRSYRSGAARTLKSIQITLLARLEKFNLESLASLTMADELDLSSMGEKKSVLFAVIPDNDTSFNFLISILYTQLFQQLERCADQVHGGKLPVPVHFLMDEFANVSLPDDFEKILSTVRSRGISVSIILQNLSQLKALFEKQWESIVGDCDTFLYMGGNEQSTHKYVSELLGKETIDTNTYGKSDGMRGNFSTNYQISGRELLTPDEVRMLDNRYAILFIRGEKPVRDLKYDLRKHPAHFLTPDGGAAEYTHGRSDMAVCSISVQSEAEVGIFPETTVPKDEAWEVISDEELYAEMGIEDE